MLFPIAEMAVMALLAHKEASVLDRKVVLDLAQLVEAMLAEVTLVDMPQRLSITVRPL